MARGGRQAPHLDRLYMDPWLVALYEALNTGRRDFDFYRARLPGSGARVLDIGCGTGDFALELAEAEFNVTGLDPSAQMIDRARAKPGAPAVTWVIGTTADLAPGVKFDAVVMTGHAFQCLLEDALIKALFKDVAGCLSREGRFFFETRNRGYEAWKHWDGARQVAANGAGTVDRSVIWVRTDRVCFEERYTLASPSKPVTSRSILRFASLSEITDWLSDAGLAVASVHGDWAGGAYDPLTSPEIILETCLKSHDRLVPGRWGI